MARFRQNSRLIGQGFPALAIVAALGLSGCGGGSDDAASDATGDQDSNTSEAPGGDRSQDSDDPQDVDAPDPVAILPFEVDVPSGSTMLKAKCEPGGPKDPEGSTSSNDTDDPDSDTDDSDTDDDEREYSTWITYAVPDTWEPGGHGSGGSGSVTGTDEDRSFLPDGKNRVKVSVDWDGRDPEGNLTDHNGDPWESFDYESSVGDDETTITYENVATVQAGDQEADLFHLDPAQAPEHVSDTEYKVRLNAFELPRRNFDGSYELVPESFVVTIEFDQTETPLEQETIESLVESFVLPECSWDTTLLDHELLTNLDLNGDGHIRDSEDVQEEMKDIQKDLEKQLDDLREDSKDE